ncbi:MAG TPA: cache domain-containing protein, partial [Albitalea sp.]|nr:cache domain-containing protein [Albitalea sp.]
MHARRKSLLTRLAGPTAVWLALLGLSGAAAWAAYGWSEGNGYARLDDAAARQLDLYAAVLENELGKHAYLPGLIEIDQDVAALLSAPAADALRDAVNRKLTRFTVEAGALASFVVDSGGRVVAASDWYRPDTVLGRELASRPFFADAMRGEPARFFSANAERGAPEYTFAQPLVRDARVLGVVVVRISLDPMEATWIDSAVRADSEKPLVVDERGVIIISSDPRWKFKALASLAPAERQRLAALGVYAGRPIEPLGLTVEGPLEHGAQLVRLAETPKRRSAPFVLHERPIPRFNWRLLSLSDVSDVWRTARLAAWSAGAVTAFMGLFLLYQLQRRRVMAQKLAARAALQRAHDELELKVQQRTAELQASNSELQHEIVERRHAEAVLRRAQQELVQAGKLAALGQMSASVSHEIGQPLTALRALS